MVTECERPSRGLIARPALRVPALPRESHVAPGGPPPVRPRPRHDPLPSHRRFAAGASQGRGTRLPLSARRSVPGAESEGGPREGVGGSATRGRLGDAAAAKAARERPPDSCVVGGVWERLKAPLPARPQKVPPGPPSGRLPFKSVWSVTTPDLTTRADLCQRLRRHARRSGAFDPPQGNRPQPVQ